MKTEPHKRTRIARSLVDATSYELASSRILEWAKATESHCVIAANVHVLMTGFFNASYQKVIDAASMVTPDGMPLVWTLRLMGRRKQTRVYGPDLMLSVCEGAGKNSVPIYLYGGTPGTLEKLTRELKTRFPDLRIAGTRSPPFRPLTEDEDAADVEDIIASGAGIVFVGLGAPKQEIWAEAHRGRLPMPIVSVGAAFDFISGTAPQAPSWMMKAGLEWLHRLCTNPWKILPRHLINDPVFILLACLQVARHWLGGGRRQT